MSCEKHRLISRRSNERRAIQGYPKSAGDRCHLAGPHRRHPARVSVGIFVMTCGRRHRVQAQGLALPLRSLAGLAQDEEPKCAGSEARGGGRLGSGWMATPLIVPPPPLPLPLPDERGCSRCRLGGAVPSVSHSLPVFALFGVSLGGGAFLAALRSLSALRCVVHAGKTPTHERRSPT
jgi:hypothetical protein